MTQKQFRHDMRRGLGSCQLVLDQCSNIEDFRAEVLWGMQYALSYDAQCEGTRAIYLFDMIERFDDWSEFHTFAAAGARRNVKDRGWRFAHYTEILALMAGAGYNPAQETMQGLYELLLHTIQAGHPSRNGIWPALDNFSHVCVSILTNVLHTQTDREIFYLRVLTDHGKTLARKPTLGSRCEDDWFEAVAEEHIGDVRIHELLAQKRSDPDITRYLENRDRLQAERKICQARVRQQAEAESAQSIYGKLRDGAIPGKKLPLLLLRRMAREQGNEEIIKLAHLYAEEDQAHMREALLHLFRDESSISAFQADGISRLLRDAESENDSLQEAALRVLADIHSDRVREYALLRLKRHTKDIHAIYMLITNFHPGDGKRLISLVKSVSLNEHNGDWHGVFSQVRGLIDRDEAANRELSEALLPYMLREGYCSCCRLYLLELMQPRGLLTPELIEECQWDCSMEIRELAAKSKP